MQRDDLATYIRKEMDSGLPKAEIISSLVAGGWQQADVEKAFDEAERGRAKKKPFSPSFDFPTSAPQHHIIKNLFLILVILAIVFLVVAYILGGQP